MRLVTYDRGGARRLGAWVEGDIVLDLPDVVGHPAFPSTMEALVARGGGTTLDAAAEALSRRDWWEGCLVPNPRLLAPLVMPDVRLLGPDDEVPWPAGFSGLGCRPEVACIVGRSSRGPAEGEDGGGIVGYALANVWSATRPKDDRALAVRVGTSLGPWVVTPDEFDPGQARLVTRVDGRMSTRRAMAATPRTFAKLLAHAPRGVGLEGRDAVRSRATLRGLIRPVDPGATVEVEAKGLGVLRNRVGRRPSRRGLPRLSEHSQGMAS